MSELFPPGQHPDADQLSAFAEHILPAHEQQETLAHLAVCSHCRSVVALSLPPIETAPKPLVQPLRRSHLKIWLWPAVVALAAMVTVGIYVHNAFVSPIQAPTQQVATSAEAGSVSTQAPPVPAVKPETAPPVAQRAPRVPAAISGAAARSRDSASRGSAANPSFSSYGALAAAPAAPRPDVVAFRRIAADEAHIIVQQHPLPSGLHAISAIASPGHAIALDADHTLFFSADSGAHWQVIAPSWPGRAVKVALVTPATRVAAPLPETAQPQAVGGMLAVDSVQKNNASLEGKVNDPSGAAIPNASVEVTNLSNQMVYRTTTDPAGHYLLNALTPGPYTIAANAPGFSPQSVSGVGLSSAELSQRDLTLAVGAATQTVEVQGQTPIATFAAPPLKQQVEVKPPAIPLPRSFEITTDTGEHWISSDGRLWRRSN